MSRVMFQGSPPGRSLPSGNLVLVSVANVGTDPLMGR
jgi:hypothetical protein